MLGTSSIVLADAGSPASCRQAGYAHGQAQTRSDGYNDGYDDGYHRIHDAYYVAPLGSAPESPDFEACRTAGAYALHEWRVGLRSGQNANPQYNQGFKEGHTAGASDAEAEAHGGGGIKASDHTANPHPTPTATVPATTDHPAEGGH
ncbi:MAG TPA: hypothetical protein VL588_02600 [Bdellovibrionota bacterium]|nr:hypothetical protein [Bdellovibrionota bacterium]